MFLKIILATFLVSLVSFVGILITSKHLQKIIHYLISFAAASLISVVFFDLIPEALEILPSEEFLNSLAYIVGGIVLFFLIETFLHWHHCGKEGIPKKPTGSLLLGGDFFHNFFDGLLIAGSFLIGNQTGMLVTFSVLIHEIPHEVGNFAILVHSGFKRKKALLLNFYSALSAVLGGILGYFLLDLISYIIPYLILVSAGGLLYIALSDIVPSMHEHLKESHTGLAETLIFVLTVLFFKIFLTLVH
ncbi:hypothetical protein COT60_01955 [Candidatus Pacearchaeota archaeon CG09_land_8_20_14_0_10_30_9]|nr:ZIP family metal transporter [Candidatus Pacearchaeota archaeon]OIO40171.1 MAG: hypothetical protein AUJ61_02420 [Candidatus Pacearchaeota archaeon CG1_02_30_18]PIN71413.1 MAG: hypothetical protein COV77_02145 [Candidatus Pacearchaeota archaeon CG11_big_fil_rev_8_21_14_0_20_30_13]PIO01151.1 MAG: hypothetical protein COT60_01955 [Candidatus Pacearchaeota archaeon CG09_land_8_20_14_0_10_30_9]